MKKCPYCAEEIQDEAIVCRYCGRDLQTPTTNLPTATTETPTTNLPAATPQTPAPTTKPNKPKSNLLLKAVLGVVGICVICVALSSFLAAMNPDKKLKDDPVNALVATNAAAITDAPKPTRTPQPTATPETGILDNPYPYNTEAQLKSSSLGNESLITIQVLNVLRGEDANAIVKSANPFNDDPPEGTSWMLVNVKVTLNEGSAVKLNDWDLGVISNGQIFDLTTASACCTEEAGFPQLDANIALPGTSVEGWIIRPVFLTDEKPLLVYGINVIDPNLEDGNFFALHP